MIDRPDIPPYVLGLRLGMYKQGQPDFLGGVKKFWTGLSPEIQKAVIGGGAGLLGGAALGGIAGRPFPGALVGGALGAGLGYFAPGLFERFMPAAKPAPAAPAAPAAPVELPEARIPKPAPPLPIPKTFEPTPGEEARVFFEKGVTPEEQRRQRGIPVKPVQVQPSPSRIELHRPKLAPTREEYVQQQNQIQQSGQRLTQIVDRINKGVSEQEIPQVVADLERSLKSYAGSNIVVEPFPAADGKYYGKRPDGTTAELPMVGGRVPTAFAVFPESPDPELNNIMRGAQFYGKIKFWTIHKNYQTAKSQLWQATQRMNVAQALGGNVARGFEGLNPAEQREYSVLQRMSGRITGAGRAEDIRLRESRMEALGNKMQSNDLVDQYNAARAGYEGMLSQYEDQFARPDVGGATMLPGLKLMTDHPIMGHVVFDARRGYIPKGDTRMHESGEFAVAPGMGKEITHNEWIPTGPGEGVRIVNNRWYPALVDPETDAVLTGVREIDRLMPDWDPSRPYRVSTKEDARTRENWQAVEVATLPFAWGKTVLARTIIGTETGRFLYSLISRGPREYPTETPALRHYERPTTVFERAWRRFKG